MIQANHSLPLPIAEKKKWNVYRRQIKAKSKIKIHSKDEVNQQTKQIVSKKK